MPRNYGEQLLLSGGRYGNLGGCGVFDKDIFEGGTRIYDMVRYRDWETDRKSTRLNSSHSAKSRMPSSA